jgi:NAD(P)H-dependent flavin oxidoreductase YrpB (nitropropane dioxygenase family)
MAKLQTALTSLLKIDAPVIQAPMSVAASPALIVREIVEQAARVMAQTAALASYEVNGDTR